MPARAPRSVKLMRGTLRQSREPLAPATPRPGRAQPPSWLPLMERVAFKELAAETERTGTPTRSFADALTGAAVARATLQRTTVVLAERGETYETTTTTGALKIVARPEVQLRNTALRLLKAYLSELGLTPAAIGRVDRAALPKEDDASRKSREVHDRFFG